MFESVSESASVVSLDAFRAQQMPWETDEVKGRRLHDLLLTEARLDVAAGIFPAIS